MPGSQRLIHQQGELVNPQGQQVLEPGADHMEGHPEHQGHNAHEGGDGGVFPGEEPVNLPAPLVLPAFSGLHHRLLTELLDEGKAHVRNGGGPVQATLLLHLADDMIQHLLFVLGQTQGLQHQLIPFHQLAGGKAHGNPRGLGVVFNQVHDAVETAVDRAAVVVLVAKVRSAGPLLILGNVDGVTHQLLHALVLGGHNGHHGDAQQLLHFVNVDGASVAPDLVHHVEGQNDGHIQLHQLHG